MTKLRGRGNSSEPRDWLKDLDSRVRKLPRAEGWTYPLFLFARYPLLQPRRKRDALLHEALREDGFESLSSLLLDWEKRISSHKDGQRALEGVKPDLRHQLAALLVDIEDDFETFTNRKQAKDWSRKLGQEGPRRQRMLFRKLEKARQSLSDLYQYSNALEPSLGLPYREAAAGALDRLTQFGTRSRFEDLVTLSRELSRVTKDPTAFAMVQLYWFFRTGCELSGHESEVRVGLIRNAFWTRWKVAPVPVIPKYIPGESMGCQAVRTAVCRFPIRETPR